MAIPGRRSGAGVRSLEADERLGDAENGVSVDEVLLAPGGVAQGGGGNAIDLAQGPLRMLVERRERVIGEDGAVAAGSVEPESNVLGRVLDGGGGEQEAMVNAGEHGAMRASGEVGLELWEADEDEGQEGLGVPLVIEEDVKVRQHVWMQQVRFVEEEDGMRLVPSEILDVSLDGEEEIRGRRRRVQSERVAEIAVEVSASERGVAAIGQSEAGLGEIATEGSEDARLADTGLAEQKNALAIGEGLHDVHDERRLALGEPQVGVIELFGERGGAQAKGA
jgi:hypothetical protein